MAWYPEGSGSGPTDKPAEPSDDMPTLSQQTAVQRPPSDDDPTIARPGLTARPGGARRRRTEPDEPTVDDDDPTVNRPALSKTKPAAELLDHRYQLLGQIGVGGMGEVWRARHVKLARDVAIKFLTNEEGGSRFEQEAQVIAGLRHTGVVDVLDFGETTQGVPYFVMELLEGETLSARVRHTGPLAWAQVRHIALEVSDALAHAHKAGVIHRDLKPSNVIVLESPPPRGSSTKLIDFGIAKLLDEQKPKITKAGFIQGTPAYMSPEQVLGEDVDARSDVYGLGCLLYYLLSGVRPFPDKTGTAALRAQLYEQPPRFGEVVPGLHVPGDVESVVFRAMAKDKSARFESMVEFHAALMAIPPDAGASLTNASPPSRLKPKVVDPLRSTASYSASYDALNAADAAAGSGGEPGPSGSSSQLGTPPSQPSMAAPREDSAGEKAKLVAAIVASVVLVIGAIVGLVWALTS